MTVDLSTLLKTGGSRYDSPTTAAHVTDVNTTGSKNESGTSASSGTTSGTTTSAGTSNSTTTTNNLDAGNMAVLNKLIQQLLGGGTPEMRQQQAARSGEVKTVQGIRQGYSKEAAFADAQGLIAQQLRRALEASMPSISRAAEDAGSSGGALRALLMQDASQRAAESSSALGVQTATNYGNIASNLSQVLEALTRSDPAVTNALVAALNVAKGANTTSTTNGSTTGTQNTVGQTNQTGSTTGKTTSTENKDYAPFQQNNTPIYFGPSSDSNTVSNDVLSRVSTINALAEAIGGNNNAWSGYTF